MNKKYWCCWTRGYPKLGIRQPQPTHYQLTLSAQIPGRFEPALNQNIPYKRADPSKTGLENGLQSHFVKRTSVKQPFDFQPAFPANETAITNYLNTFKER